MTDSLELYLKPVSRLPSNTCVVDEIDGEDLIWVPREHACWICGQPTCWLELNFEAPTCPGCVDKAWRQYWEATQEVVRKYGPWEKGLDSPPTPGVEPSHQVNDMKGTTMNNYGPPDGPDGPPPAA